MCTSFRFQAQLHKLINAATKNEGMIVILSCFCLERLLEQLK